MAENWQSEYLRFLLFVLATIWLIQRGSPESMRPSEVGLESDEKQQLGKHIRSDSPAWARAGRWRTAMLSRSLGLTTAGLFLLCWLTQFVSGRAAHNGEQLSSFQDPLGAGEYLPSADFWNRSPQNWQSEFLAIASMAILSVYLRHRGSPESKLVGPRTP
ncbi:DUF6766 family protein [Actinokineospora sp.]|uniref:DUF6766 family protein n=1 Tax=Actinokineospora sp. TaxID=1872133 RepID=UPI003D6C174B